LRGLVVCGGGFALEAKVVGGCLLLEIHYYEGT